MRIDLHCDTLTATPAFCGHIRLNRLRTEKAFQCFAVFTEDDCAAAYAAAKSLFYSTLTPSNGFAPVKNLRETCAAMQKGLAPCALTCENIGFTLGRKKALRGLKQDGVIMASLVWNRENNLAFPNVRTDGKREGRGLKKRGAETVEILDEEGIIIDISHLSDGGVRQILAGRKIPAAASHSDCDKVCENARNLADWQLKMLADCGGVAGINFYKKFLGGKGGFTAVAAHLKHMIKVGGEDLPAFGSDWDGVPGGGISICPGDMPELFDYLAGSGIPPRVLEKAAYSNFARVMGEVLR